MVFCPRFTAALFLSVLFIQSESAYGMPVSSMPLEAMLSPVPTPSYVPTPFDTPYPNEWLAPDLSAVTEPSATPIPVCTQVLAPSVEESAECVPDETGWGCNDDTDGMSGSSSEPRSYSMWFDQSPDVEPEGQDGLDLAEIFANEEDSSFLADLNELSILLNAASALPDVSQEDWEAAAALAGEQFVAFFPADSATPAIADVKRWTGLLTDERANLKATKELREKLDAQVKKLESDIETVETRRAAATTDAARKIFEKQLAVLKGEREKARKTSDRLYHNEVSISMLIDALQRRLTDRREMRVTFRMEGVKDDTSVELSQGKEALDLTGDSARLVKSESISVTAMVDTMWIVENERLYRRYRITISATDYSACPAKKYSARTFPGTILADSTSISRDYFQGLKK